MRILVTGATGFIGSRLVDALLAQGHAVTALVRETSDTTFLRAGNVNLLTGDLRDARSIEALPAQPWDAVFHCAAMVADSDPRALFKSNVIGTGNICELAQRSHAGRFIYLSSVAVISGNPRSPLTDDLPYRATNLYGHSKIEAEKIVLSFRQQGLPVAILRPSMVYGEGEPHMQQVLLRLLQWRLLALPARGRPKMHLAYVGTVVRALLLALQSDVLLEGTFLVADEDVLSMREIFTAFSAGLDAPAPWLLPCGMTPLLRRLPWLGRRLDALLKDRVYDISRLKAAGFPAGEYSTRALLVRTAREWKSGQSAGQIFL
ncbi:MAG TPA: NAD(P)-dependent oxidoreductase [Candidatus Omnitrophota bacterium]|nr:NAD(P)-dependent oxidoreductase [Candidatus Omnitrophota bacterium]